MPTYYKPPRPYTGIPMYYVYPLHAPIPGFSSSQYVSSPAWTTQSLPSPSPWPSSPREPPKAPRPRIIPLPYVGDDSLQNGGHGRTSYRPSPPDYASPFLLNGRPSINPILAVPQHPMAKPSFTWDLMYTPSVALLDSPAVSYADLRRPAIRSSGRSGGQTLRSLVLKFPLLPMEIEIRHSSVGASGAPCTTVGDVLEGLYQGLRSCIEPDEFLRLTESERATLLRAAETRCRYLPEDTYSRGTLRKIDYLARRRRFIGMRTAERSELPRGRSIGEVFIVEVGTGDR